MLTNLEVSDTEIDEAVDDEEAVSVALGAWITFGKPDVKSVVEAALELEVFVASPDLVLVLVLEVITKEVGNQFKVLEEEVDSFELDDFELEERTELATGLRVEVGNWSILVAWETDAEYDWAEGVNILAAVVEACGELELATELEAMLVAELDAIDLEELSELNDKDWLKMLPTEELLVEVKLELWELVLEPVDDGEVVELSELVEEVVELSKLVGEEILGTL